MSKTRIGYELLMLVPAVEVNGVPWIVTPTGLVNYETPTVAALNVWHGITKPSDTYASQGGNISCAVLDDLNLGLTDSETDDTKTICSKGNSAALTLYNYDAELNFKRDKDITADSLWNLARDLTRAPDLSYFIVHRVRGEKDSTEPLAIGDEIDLYYVHTDFPVPGYSDDDPIQTQSAFIPKGIVNVGYDLAA
ncbi:MAG: hypothetical protein K0Q52_117 [Microbacterium sp.]|jgi:hypothetical protein|nr:hypothetical protein [Microbacterium sp.]